MTLKDLGLTESLLDQYASIVGETSKIARVVQENRESYIVRNTEGVFRAEITGNLRFAAASRDDFPAVGDWVSIQIYDGDAAIIFEVLPRFSKLERQTVGAHAEKQLIATNIDFAFVVQGLDRDFNVNRLERYFVMAHKGNIHPIVILNKADLQSKEMIGEAMAKITERLGNPKVYVTSTLSGSGLEKLKDELLAGKTYCLLGSSGVGKSSIINYLLDRQVLEVNAISESTSKGRHTTTHRELVVLDGGSLLIDTPGMRELGITEGGDGLEKTFGKITELAVQCRFPDCTHTDEPGCKVLEALEAGSISEEAYSNFKKLERQEAHFSATLAEKRKRDKSFGKMVKEIKKHKKKHKY